METQKKIVESKSLKVREITIGTGMEGVLPTGSYQNQRPSFFVQIKFENSTMNDDEIFAYQKTLNNRCYQNFKDVEIKAIIERTERLRRDFRFYPSTRSDRKFPSVTTIINFDEEFYVAPHLLREYAGQSSINHKLWSHFFKTKKLITSKELINIYPELSADYASVVRGELMLPLDNYNFEGYLKKYPMEVSKYDYVVINEEHEYGGSPDWSGKYLDLRSMFDAKRTVDAVKGFMQIAAYIKADEAQGAPKYEQMVLVPMNATKTQQGFSKPTTSIEIDKYFNLFLKNKREPFRGLYGC